jgi:flagellar hook-basal body complex protein FliE
MSQKGPSKTSGTSQARPALLGQSISEVATLLQEAADHMTQAYRNKKQSTTLHEVRLAKDKVNKARVWFRAILDQLEAKEGDPSPAQDQEIL